MSQGSCTSRSQVQAQHRGAEGKASKAAQKGKAGKKDESAKEHITVNIALKATGTIKTTFQVINKAKKPKCCTMEERLGTL